MIIGEALLPENCLALGRGEFPSAKCGPFYIFPHFMPPSHDRMVCKVTLNREKHDEVSEIKSEVRGGIPLLLIYPLDLIAFSLKNSFACGIFDFTRQLLRGEGWCFCLYPQIA